MSVGVGIAMISGGIDLSTFGRNAAAQEKGAFTEYGYIVESGDEWDGSLRGAKCRKNTAL